MAIAANNFNRLVAVGGSGAGGVKLATVNIVGDTNYPTGGSINVTAILAAAGADISAAIRALIPITQLGYEWDYIAGTDKLKVYQQPAAAAAGPSPEVPNATNLSAVTVSCLVIYE